MRGRNTRVFIDTFIDGSGEVMVRGRRVRFDYSRVFGPLVVDKSGEPLDRQPISERDPFWVPFNAWLAEFDKTNPDQTRGAP